MEIVRCTKSFRSAGVGGNEGGLYPAAHPLVKRFPSMFEPVSAYVARRFPDYVPAEPDPETKPASKPAARPRRTSSK